MRLRISRRFLQKNIIQVQCPTCEGITLANLGSMPINNARSGDKFEVTCPHCSETIQIGYVYEFRKVREEVDEVSPQPSTNPSGGSDEQEEAEPEPTAETSGGGGGLASSSPTTSNDQRSDVMNPNNPASQAAGDNRSNQMNPNSQAYRSSRRG